MISAAQVRQGTELDSLRIAAWGYEPDLYGDDLYTHRVPVHGKWMPPITGQTGSWTPDAFADQPDAGTRLFWDLISLFYEVEATTNEPINVQQNYVAHAEGGAASYRFDHLPQRSVDKILPANYELDRIAGVVRLSGGTGNDSVIVNAHDAGGLHVDLRKQVLELADYSFDVTTLTPPAGATHKDVQAALRGPTRKPTSTCSTGLPTARFNRLSCTCPRIRQC